jgi:cobalt-zinc-cadmium efflux system outer membrane protein
MKCHCIAYLTCFVLLVSPAVVKAQKAVSPNALADLLVEAERNNPQIQGARHEFEAAKLVPTQLSTRPDPQFVLQHVSVGSPRPFAGYTNSDFAYVGLGVSQDIPYPGKLHLRGEIAKKDSESLQQKYESIRRANLTGVKQTYFQLSYLREKRRILGDDETVLRQVEESAEVRYRAGQGNQQEVLQAQLEQTKLLREITANDLEMEKLEARFKQLLNRPQSSADIEPASLPETSLPYTYDQLLTAASATNPEIAAMKKNIEKQQLQIDMARKDFYPDFNVQYMWQRTDPTEFRAYYSFTFSARVPIYRKRRQDPELAQARAEKSRAESDYEVESQQVALELREAFATAEKSAELLRVYREGLMPQSRAALQAGMAAYQSNRQDFQALLASFLDVLKLEEEYQQILSERESALAGIEQITGLSLQ